MLIELANLIHPLKHAYVYSVEFGTVNTILYFNRETVIQCYCILYIKHPQFYFVVIDYGYRLLSVSETWIMNAQVTKYL